MSLKNSYRGIENISGEGLGTGVRENTCRINFTLFYLNKALFEVADSVCLCFFYLFIV